MKKNVTDILDIHTHKQEVDTQGKSIINYPLLADSPLYMPLAENVEVAVGRGSYYSIGIHPWEVRESNVSQQLSFLQQQLQSKVVGKARFAVDYSLRESNGRTAGCEKRISPPTTLDMAWLSWKTGAGGTVVEERVLSFFWGILSR